ncbi:MAG: hypothetical protein KF819_41120 [Labilithrix sp.]|nr:hypothetical protein [Labilithrix sp.]
MKKRLFAVVALALGIATVIWFSRHNAPASAGKSEPEDRLDGPPAPAESSVAPSVLPLAELTDGATLTREHVAAPGDGSSIPTETPVSAAGIHQRDLFAAAFVAEPRDGAWAPEARRLVDSRFRALMPIGSSVRTVECRSTMCRVETEHSSLSEYNTFSRAAFADPKTRVWDGEVFTTAVQDAIPLNGTIQIVTFLAREGAFPAVQ